MKKYIYLFYFSVKVVRFIFFSYNMLILEQSPVKKNKMSTLRKREKKRFHQADEGRVILQGPQKAKIS